MSARVLVVAGRDSSGRAGIDADRDAAAYFDEPLDAVVTAETEQDARGFRAMNARAPELWFAEAQKFAGHAGHAIVIKLGLLPGPDHMQAAAQLAACGRGPVVLDPVLSASTGEDFAVDGSLDALREVLIPCGVVLTPNIPEAARLLDRDESELASSRDARVEAARALVALGAKAVLLKGGHQSGDLVGDLVLEAGGEPHWIDAERIPGAGIRGSGCRYATSVACMLARNSSLVEAAEAAGRFVRSRIQSGT